MSSRDDWVCLRLDPEAATFRHMTSGNGHHWVELLVDPEQLERALDIAISEETPNRPSTKGLRFVDIAGRVEYTSNTGKAMPDTPSKRLNNTAAD